MARGRRLVSQPQAEEEGLTRVVTSVIKWLPPSEQVSNKSGVCQREGGQQEEKVGSTKERSRSLRTLALHRTKAVGG